LFRLRNSSDNIALGLTVAGVQCACS